MRRTANGLTTLAAVMAPLPCHAQGVITTVAGTGTCCNSADGRTAISTWLPSVNGVTVDRAGTSIYSGRGLGPTSAMTAPAPGYPTSLGDTSVTFTPADGGAAVDAMIRSAQDAQLARQLPSSVAPGVYVVRVTYNGQSSAPQNVTVVARSFGIASINSGGAGPARATIDNVNGGISLVRFTSGTLTLNDADWTLTPAHPRDTLVLSGAGGGADPANDTGDSSGDQTAAGNFTVIVGSRQITPSYAGTVSGSPGVWQIKFTLPDDIEPNCFTAVQVSADGELSNQVTIAIAATGETACSDPQLNQAALAKLDAGRDLVFGGFGAARQTTTGASSAVTELIAGFFARYTAAEWSIQLSGPRFGPCVVYDRTYPTGGKDPATPEAFLNAGARLSVSGPGLPPGAGLGTITGVVGPSYNLTLTPGALAGGKYTLAGSGGSQVGPFSVSADFPSSFAVTNWDSLTLIDSSNPLTVNWTGAGFDQVVIIASSSTRINSMTHIATITCTVPADAGTFSIPSGALAYLPPVSASAGALTVSTTTIGGIFTADLVGGGQIDIGNFAPSLGVTKSIAVQ